MSQAALDSAVSALLTRFRRQRPLRSGSLLITVLGDAIAPRGGAVTLGSLIALARPFGLTERLVRTTVGRLAKEGWLTAQRSGRQSEYTLTAHGRTRFAEATQRIYSEAPPDWDRQWTLLILDAESGERRGRIREEMLWLGFGQLTAGVLAHPSRSVADVRRQLKESGMGNHAIVLQAASGGRDQDRRLISTGWDLAELTRGYRRFVQAFTPVQEILHRRDWPSTERSFVIRTLLIHEYRKIHLRDPLLPQDLLPEDWIGTKAYALCQDLYREVFARSEEFLTANATQLTGALPGIAREAARRFGGLRQHQASAASPTAESG